MTQVLTGLFPLFAALLERLTSSGAPSSGFRDSGPEGFDAGALLAAAPDGTGFLTSAPVEGFFAAAFSLARVMPFALSRSNSCFRPAAVVGIGGRSMFRGSDNLGALAGREEDFNDKSVSTRSNAVSDQ